MKVIQVLFAAIEELHDEALHFSELISHLNEILEPRGIHLKRVKWTPGQAKDYRQKLSQCEMCLKLYWKQLPETSEEELKIAYEATCAGDNPRNLYVFFKEPSEGISKALADFKASFETRYGHFFCRFENVDTLNLHFLLQLEATQNTMSEGLIKVADGHISVGDQQFVNLDNVPFAGLNKEYRRLQDEVVKLENQLATILDQYKANPDNEDLLGKLTATNIALQEAQNEYNRYQRFLVNKELEFIQSTNEIITDRMRMARESFEKGDAEEAARLMNWDELKKDKEHNRALGVEYHKLRETEIVGFRSSASYAMADSSKTYPERFAAACKALDEAIDTAREIHYDDDKLAKLLFDYAALLKQFNHLEEAVQFFSESLPLWEKAAQANSKAFLPQVASTMNFIGLLQQNLNRTSEAIGSLEKSLDIFRKIKDTNPGAFLPCIAATLNNLAIARQQAVQFEEAIACCEESLEIYQYLLDNGNSSYLDWMASTLHTLANLKKDLQKDKEAETLYLKALEIRRELAKDNRVYSLSNVANTLNNLGILQDKRQNYEQAEIYYNEALQIWQRLIATIPIVFYNDYAKTLNNIGVLQQRLEHYEKAEHYYYISYKIRLVIANYSHEAFSPDVAQSLFNLARVKQELKQYKEAESLFNESLKFYRSSNNNQYLFVSGVAAVLWHLCLLSREIGEKEQSTMYFSEFFEAFMQLDKKSRKHFIEENEGPKKFAKRINHLGILTIAIVIAIIVLVVLL